MRTVQAIIELLGGLDRLETNPIKVKNEGYMDLVIEYVGVGPRGCPLVSVAHYFEQNGDLCADPDLVMEWMVPAGKWLPVSFKNDAFGYYVEAVRREGDALIEDSGAVADILAFQRSFDMNLRTQGFVEAARR
jgi:hypothetical protein